MGILRLVCVYYLFIFGKIIKNCKLDRDIGNGIIN